MALPFSGDVGVPLSPQADRGVKRVKPELYQKRTAMLQRAKAALEAQRAGFSTAALELARAEALEAWQQLPALAAKMRAAERAPPPEGAATMEE